MDQKLLDYVTAQRAAGFSEREIRVALVQQGGWSIEEVNDAFRLVGFTQPVVRKHGHRRAYEAAVAVWILLALLVSWPYISKYVPATGTDLAKVEQTEGTYVYCGDDDSCFADNVRACKPAKAAVTQNTPDGQAMYIETVEGLEAGKCAIEVYYVNHPNTEAVGKSMRCLVPATNLGSYREYVQGARLGECTGDLVNALA